MITTDMLRSFEGERKSKILLLRSFYFSNQKTGVRNEASPGERKGGLRNKQIGVIQPGRQAQGCACTADKRTGQSSLDSCLADQNWRKK